jgi:hypothetical protein
MQRVIVLSISAAVMIWAASAVADSPNLKGDYVANGTTSCISAMDFSEPPGNLALSFGNDQWTAVQGIRTFNGDGTGSVLIRT